MSDIRILDIVMSQLLLVLHCYNICYTKKLKNARHFLKLEKHCPSVFFIEKLELGVI